MRRGMLPTLRGQDRGASAILIALSTMVIFGFAALAVDSGLKFNERRQHQSAADFGALAAVQFARTNPPTSHPDCAVLIFTDDIAACRGAEEAIEVIDGSLPGYFSDADWDACIDASKPAEYSQQSFISDCISFTANFQRSRVVLPRSEVDAAFAGVIGFAELPVGAGAEAKVDFDIIGGVWPFAVGPSASGDTSACFFSQAALVLNIEPCTTANQGNFGKLSLYTYGNETYGTPQICNGFHTTRIATNVVTGTDHPLEPKGKTPGTVNDQLNCALITNPVDQVEVWTGNAAGALKTGLLGSISQPPLEGRLLCKTGEADEAYPLGQALSTSCVRVNPAYPDDVDHSPLWAYLNPAVVGETPGGECTPAGGITNRAQMVTCLEGWMAYGGAHTGPLFTDDILTSPRFGAVPLLEFDPGNGFGFYNIMEFLPVYAETLYLGCNALTCQIVHSPGEPSSGSCPAVINPTVSSCGWPAGGNRVLEALTVFMLDLDSMFSDAIKEKFPYQDGTTNYDLYR